MRQAVASAQALARLQVTTIRPEEATGAAAEVFAKIKKAVGKVPNAYATVGTHSPEALSAVLA
ncbi:hypothetical protein EN817_31095, partial [Mesorhizobium sp. M3A.F.Ca.ET.174.01.1.1]